MSTHETANKYVMAFVNLRTDEEITSEERMRKAQVLAKELIGLGDDELVDQVLSRFGSVEDVLFGFLAGEIEKSLETQPVRLPDGDTQLGTLIVIPVMCCGPPGATLPEKINTSLLPPLPDGRRVPGCSGVLLNWKDLYVRSSHVRQLHTVLTGYIPSDTNELRDARVRNWRGPATEDWLTECMRRDGEAGSIRFLAAYRLSTDPSWFESEAQMDEWGKSGFTHAGRLAGYGWTIVLLPPRPLIFALYIAHGHYVAFQQEEFEKELATRGFARDDVDILMEPYGARTLFHRDDDTVFGVRQEGRRVNQLDDASDARADHAAPVARSV